MKHFLLIFFSCISILSCRKDDLEFTSPLPNFLNVEYSENVDTTIINKLIHSYSNESINLDLNGNDTVDVSVFCSFFGSNGLGYYSDFYVKALNPKVNFIGTAVTDTIFYYTKIDTTSTPDFQGKTYITTREITSCIANSSNYSIVSINNSKLVFNAFDLNNKIELKDTVYQNIVPLTDESYSQNNQLIDEINDTIYSKRIVRKFNCKNVITYGDTYFGFSIKNQEDTALLGWIKLNYETNKLTIIETAIQNSN